MSRTSRRRRRGRHARACRRIRNEASCSVAVSIELQRKVRDGNGFARINPVEHRLENVASLGPHIHTGPTESAGVQSEAQNWDKGVVVEPSSIGAAPCHEHWLPGGQQNAHQTF